MMQKLLTCLIVLLLAAGPAVPGPADALKTHHRVAEVVKLLELWMQAELDYREIPGISVALVHDQELVWSAGFGFANPDKTVRATPTTLYSICSISKLFTSLAVMQLRDAGKLRLDDPVGSHLSWFDIGQAHPGSPPVTVRGILTHSSGLPRESAQSYWSAPDFAFPSRSEIIDGLSGQETLYPADLYSQYSNLGLTLAGEIVSELSGKTYADYVRENLLDPIGLNDTRPEMPESLYGDQLAVGYSAMTRDGDRKKVRMFQANGIAPAAGYSSTVEDLAKFASWQFRVLAGEEESVLRRNTLREMQRVQWLDPGWRTSWGLGFGVWRSNDNTFVGHGGSCPGYRSQLLIHPKDKIAVIVMLNASGTNPRSYAQRIHELAAPAIKSASSGTAPDSMAAGLEKYTGRYSVFPWGGETAVVIAEGQLALVGLPTENPKSAMTKLKHIDGTRFKRVRSDGELGEEVVFESDASGKIVRFRRHSNIWPRIQE